MNDIKTWELLIVEWLENAGHHTTTSVICDIDQAYDVLVSFIYKGIHVGLYISPYDISLARFDSFLHFENFYFKNFNIQDPDKTLAEVFYPMQKALDRLQPVDGIW